MTLHWAIVIPIFAYFWGNISFAKLIPKLFLRKDITKYGSGVPGAGNVYRSFGFKVGLPVLLLDISKGVVPAIMGLYLIGGTEGLFMAGVAAVLGHVLPVIYKFKGGKGFATALGVFFVAYPVPMLIAFVIALLAAIYFELISPLSVITAAAMAAYAAAHNPNNYVALGCIFGIFIIVWFAHRKNIQKILTGDEKKNSLRKIFKKFSKKKPPEVLPEPKVVVKESNENQSIDEQK